MNNDDIATALRQMNYDELKELSSVIRHDIVAQVNRNGGHLSSNLGVVELTVALHRVLKLPEDKLLFDVGHQCYTHKLLSGRYEEFCRLRQSDGISGFCDINESPFDSYGSGHAGSSIAAAYGMCIARDRRGEHNRIACVVGDGSFATGEALEAFGGLAGYKGQLLIILNDNGMSISVGKGGLYGYLSKLTVKKGYRTVKQRWKNSLEGNAFGRFIKKGLSSVKRFVKRITGGDNMFEQMGVKYIGPIDGHDFKQLIGVLSDAAEHTSPVLVHVKTVKGKGIPDVEKSPAFYHGIAAGLVPSVNTFSGLVGEVLGEIVERDSSVVAITAAMEDGTGLNKLKERSADSVIDVGICEQTAVSAACGMALNGLKPVVCIYSTFLQRAFDQIQQEVCLEGLPVTFLIDRAGFVGSDGRTHQGVYDIAYMRMLGAEIYAPATVDEFRQAVNYAIDCGKPCAVRYPNGDITRYTATQALASLGGHPLNRWQEVLKGKDAVILAVGIRCIDIALKAAKMTGRSVAVYNCTSVNPLDTEVLTEIGDKAIVTLEEGVLEGGFGASVAEFYAKSNGETPLEYGLLWGGRRLKSFGANIKGFKQATTDQQLAAAGITPENVANAVIRLIKRR